MKITYDLIDEHISTDDLALLNAQVSGRFKVLVADHLTRCAACRRNAREFADGKGMSLAELFLNGRGAGQAVFEPMPVKAGKDWHVPPHIVHAGSQLKWNRVAQHAAMLRASDAPQEGVYSAEIDFSASAGSVPEWSAGTLKLSLRIRKTVVELTVTIDLKLDRLAHTHDRREVVLIVSDAREQPIWTAALSKNSRLASSEFDLATIDNWQISYDIR